MQEEPRIPEEECVAITEPLSSENEQFITGRLQKEPDGNLETVTENHSVFDRLTEQPQTNQEDNAFDTLVRTACKNFEAGGNTDQLQHQTVQDSADQELVTVVSHGVAPILGTSQDATEPINQDMTNYIESQKSVELRNVAVTKKGEMHSIPVTNVLEEAIASQNLATLAREAVIQESLVIGAQIVDRRLRDEEKPQVN